VQIVSGFGFRVSRKICASLDVASAAIFCILTSVAAIRKEAYDQSPALYPRPASQTARNFQTSDDLADLKDHFLVLEARAKNVGRPTYSSGQVKARLALLKAK
jgi:hypothetical protein